jgi:hypothetical protein
MKAQANEEWIGQLAELVVECEADDSPTPHLLRRLRDLLEISPPKVADMLGLIRPDGAFDDRLEVGAADSAAILLVGKRMGYMFSRSAKGRALASAWIEGQDEPEPVAARDEARALCGAVALACARSFAPSAIPSQPTAH